GTGSATQGTTVEEIQRRARRSRYLAAQHIVTPCAAKAYGGVRRPPQLEITDCDFKLAASTDDRQNQSVAPAAAPSSVAPASTPPSVAALPAQGARVQVP